MKDFGKEKKKARKYFTVLWGGKRHKAEIETQKAYASRNMK